MASIKSEKSMPYVYVRSRENAWVPGRLLDSDGKRATVVVQKYNDEQQMILNSPKTTGITVRSVEVELKDYEGRVLPMQNCDDRGKLDDHEDMVNLPYLHEAAILYNIKNRHTKGLPYTRTGDMIVAVNPYQWFDNLYSEERRKLYAKKLVWESSEDDPRTRLSPHVYEASALSYKGMSFDGQNQSILVSGESGAGKTETVKICMDHIASIQEGPNEGTSQGNDSTLVVQRVLDSNPLLEAFGNAKTRRNDNSSRFGKYTQLQFDRVGGVGRPLAKLAGSRCEVYLLEKNRVVSHDRDERTFHIFYQMLAASDEVKTKIWTGLKGTTNESFKYVGSTTTNTIEGMHDEEHFHRTLDVLHVLGLDWKEHVRSFLRAICVVMQLGNLGFTMVAGEEENCEISSKSELKALASLMDIPEAELALALTERTMKTRSETYKVPLNSRMAKDSADALAKEVYGRMFLWLVDAINKATCAEDNYSGERGREFGIIGLLDIFGFESFETNRFEQLCINYANEKLQQKFTEDIFRSVQAEYKMEGIPLAEITYDDNTDVLDLIEGRTGLCALLNEECVRPRGSGAGFVNKALAENRRSPCLVAEKTNRLRFGIKHYAGKVVYDAEHFVTSNNDTLATDLQECATKSSNRLISGAFEEDIQPQPTSSTPKRNRSNLMAPTIWTKYKAQLSRLMTNLHSTNSRYIRCIKPNTVKQPLLMEHVTTVEQLRCAGVVAAITISRSAFPNRLDNKTVCLRFDGFWDKAAYPAHTNDSMSKPERLKAKCHALMLCALRDKKEGDKLAFVVGKTKTYFRAGALECLEAQRLTSLDAQASTIQNAFRGYQVRKGHIRTARIKAEEETAALRKEKEQRERLEKVRKAREEEHNAEKKKYNAQIQALKEKIRTEDDRAKELVQAAEEREQKAIQERVELKQKLHNEVDAQVTAHGVEMMRLKTKLEANKKFIEFLSKENKEAHKALAKDENKLEKAKQKNRRFSSVNEDSFSVFRDIEGSAKSVQDFNCELVDKRDRATDENRLLKDQVHKVQSQYMEVAEYRLEFQKTLAFVLNTIQDNCQDDNLIEQAFCMGHECETEANCAIVALDAVMDVPDMTMSDSDNSSSTRTA